MRTSSMLALTVLLAVLAQACGFVEAAGEITIGEGQVPRLQYDLQWPKVDDVVGDAVQGADPAAVPGLPKSFEAGTLAHLQGLMTVDGECHRRIEQPAVKAKTGTLKNLVVDVVNCGAAERCVSRCQGFAGVKLETRVQLQLVDAKQAAKIQDALADTSPDAIVQIRTRFRELAFYQTEAGQKVDVGGLFQGFELGVSRPGGADESVLVEGRYVDSIDPETPQRFELDPKAPFTAAIKRDVVDGKTVWIEIFQRMRVAQPDLYSVRLGGAGVEIDLQPEFVISAIEVAKGQL